MRVFKEFREFINKGNVVDLAVAVVIGGAFGKIVSALVSDLVMPLVNAVVPQGDWRKWEVTPLHFRLGDFLGTVVDFAVVAFVVFLIMVKVVGTVNRKAAAAPTKQCPECLEMVPAAARKCRACTSVLAVVLVLLALAAPAAAQTNPAFAFAKPEEVKVGTPPPPPVDSVEWKALIKSGVLLTSGNSQTTNATATIAVSRKQNANKFSFDANVAYGQSNIIVAVVDPADMTMITGLERRRATTTNNSLVKARYDRFFTTNNSGYAAAQIGADAIAGKSIYGGGQIGYSRQLLKNDMHLLVSEIGYDFVNEHYVAQPMRVLDPVAIHSARVFIGETLKLSPTSALTGSAEAFFNLNREESALDVRTGMPGVGSFSDTRVIGKLGLTTTLWKSLSIAMGFTLRYDQNPAPRPIPAGSPAGAAFVPDFLPFANTLDTLSEATLVYTLI